MDENNLESQLKLTDIIKKKRILIDWFRKKRDVGYFAYIIKQFFTPEDVMSVAEYAKKIGFDEGELTSICKTLYADTDSSKSDFILYCRSQGLVKNQSNIQDIINLIVDDKIAKELLKKLYKDDIDLIYKMWCERMQNVDVNYLGAFSFVQEEDIFSAEGLVELTKYNLQNQDWRFILSFYDFHKKNFSALVKPEILEQARNQWIKQVKPVHIHNEELNKHHRIFAEFNVNWPKVQNLSEILKSFTVKIEEGGAFSQGGRSRKEIPVFNVDKFKINFSKFDFNPYCKRVKFQAFQDDLNSLFRAILRSDDCQDKVMEFLTKIMDNDFLSKLSEEEKSAACNVFLVQKYFLANYFTKEGALESFIARIPSISDGCGANFSNQIRMASCQSFVEKKPELQALFLMFSEKIFASIIERSNIDIIGACANPFDNRAVNENYIIPSAFLSVLQNIFYDSQTKKIGLDCWEVISNSLDDIRKEILLDQAAQGDQVDLIGAKMATYFVLKNYLPEILHDNSILQFKRECEAMMVILNHGLEERLFEDDQSEYSFASVSDNESDKSAISIYSLTESPNYSPKTLRNEKNALPLKKAIQTTL